MARDATPRSSAMPKMIRKRLIGSLLLAQPQRVAASRKRSDTGREPQPPPHRCPSFARASRSSKNEPFRDSLRRPSAFLRYGQNTILKAVPESTSHNLDVGFEFRHHPAERKVSSMLIGYARV